MSSSLLARLLNGQGNQVREEEFRLLALQAKEIFRQQPMCLELQSPVVVCGDFHAQFDDLLRCFTKMGLPPLSNYLFLGDYVDRGPKNMETIALLFCFKVQWPNKFFLLRGNHETITTNAVYGFKDEVLSRFRSINLWEVFNDTFAWMPLCALVGGRILCMHGGLSPQLNSIQQLKSIRRPFLEPARGSIEMDLLWADPDPSITGWKKSHRGCSFLFGPDVLAEKVNKLDIDLIVRAHQVVQDGIEISSCRRLITLFSAPNYCGEFNNAGAVMVIDRQLSISFVVFRPMDQ